MTETTTVETETTGETVGTTGTTETTEKTAGLATGTTETKPTTTGTTGMTGADVITTAVEAKTETEMDVNAVPTAKITIEFYDSNKEAAVTFLNTTTNKTETVNLNISGGPERVNWNGVVADCLRKFV